MTQEHVDKVEIDESRDSGLVGETGLAGEGGAGTGISFDEMLEKTRLGFSRALKDAFEGFNNSFVDTTEQLKSGMQQACEAFDTSIKEAVEAYRSAKQRNWRELMIRQFSSWIYELADDDLLAANEDRELEEEDTPDLYSFFSTLNGLKQEVHIQTKTAQTLNEKTENVLTAVRAEFAERGQMLSDTASDLKAQLPAARREGENSIIMEFLRIRDGLCQSIDTWRDKGLFRKSKKANSMRAAAIKTLELLLNKIDDSLRRLNIVATCRDGMQFDARFMRAVAVTEAGGVESGTVIKVVRQGYKKDDSLLQMADVQVQK